MKKNNRIIGITLGIFKKTIATMICLIILGIQNVSLGVIMNYTSGEETYYNVTAELITGTAEASGQQTSTYSASGATTFGATTTTKTITNNGNTILLVTSRDATGNTATRSYTVKKRLKVEVGDWINYSAGTWSQTEINSMGGLYSGASMPTSSNPYTFGGFKAGDSKNDSRNPGYTNNGEYANIYPSGWRVLSIESDGTIKITTAGTVEGYYHPYGENYGYKSEYILNKDTTNTSITDTIKNGVTPRSWKMYENGDLVVPDSAHCMTYYEAYNVTGNISATTSSNVRLTGNYYWLSSSYTSYYLWNTCNDGGMGSYNSDCFGIRPVVSLKANIKITGGTGADKANAYTLALQ